MSTSADFWTSRKAGVKAEAEADRLALDAELQKAELEALDEKSDEEILLELNLPDPDKLQAGDDFSAFMAKTVPDRLRRRALRKLWLSNPALANVDGLVDYGEDFTDSATVIENMQTAYQVGKGMLKHVIEMTKSESEDEYEVPDAPVGTEIFSANALDNASEAEEPAPKSRENGSAGSCSILAANKAHRELEENLDKTDAPTPRRRMQFAFETATGGQEVSTRDG